MQGFETAGSGYSFILSSRHWCSLAGKASLQGYYSDGVFDYENMYAARNNSGVVAIDAGGRTLVHEIGHLMGLSHSAQQDEDDGTFLVARARRAGALSR